MGRADDSEHSVPERVARGWLQAFGVASHSLLGAIGALALLASAPIRALPALP